MRVVTAGQKSIDEMVADRLEKKDLRTLTDHKSYRISEYHTRRDLPPSKREQMEAEALRISHRYKMDENYYDPTEA